MAGNLIGIMANFLSFSEPDETYHGIVYTEKFGQAAIIITKARVQLNARFRGYTFPAKFILALIWDGEHPVRMDRF